MKTNRIANHIAKLNKGDSFFVNIINGKPYEISFLKLLLQYGKIIPDPDELKRVVVPEAIDDFMNGNCIFPQMTYIKMY